MTASAWIRTLGKADALVVIGIVPHLRMALPKPKMDAAAGSLGAKVLH